MITTVLLHQFVKGVRGQALREGTRYAQEARVGPFIGSPESVSAVVRGKQEDYEVALWAGAEGLGHRCSCPSWRDPCKHEVAAALVLRQAAADDLPPPADQAGEIATLMAAEEGTDPARARLDALAERRLAARRERLRVRRDRPPFLRVTGASGFDYQVHLRGGADGPHSCDCPDFEANRLHTCKHVERVRSYLRAAAGRRLPAAHRKAAARARIYLHFGEVIEPRLLGVPRGRGAPAVRAAFDDGGIPDQPLARNEGALRRRLMRFGSWVEPEALAWLQARADRRPVLPEGDFKGLVPAPRLRPYPFQWEGARFLAASGRGLLADEMGLGKTVQAILAAAALRRAARPVKRVTVVCPASLRGGWQDEIHRWLGEEAVLVEGPATARARTIAEGSFWLITHYEQVLRDHRHHASHPPDLLIVDEAQRAKGLRTRTARVLKSIATPHLFALTGTPLENRLEEAYAIAQLVDQRLLPPLWQIERDHFVRDRKGRRVLFYRNLDALRSSLAPAFLRRRKEDVALQLPERVRSTIMVPLHPKVLDTYEDVMSAVARIAAKKVILPADMERMQRLLVIARRCCNGPHMLGLPVADQKVPKLQELEEALRDLCVGEGRKAVVFSEWTDMTDRVEALCARLRLPVFHLKGDVPVKRRPTLIRAFSEQAGPAVFVSTDAGGVGLNLQAADVVVNLDLPWNPARLEQRIARVHRIGSRGTVQVLLLVAKECIEERILQLHDTKRNVLENIWARGGEDTIAAPGGSGAFRDMLRALLQTHAGPLAEPLPRAASRVVAEPGPLETSQVPVAMAARAHASDAGVSASPTTAVVPPETPPAAAPTMDPAALATAVAAVAPALPAEHRRSLAVVFRALADALEGPPPAGPAQDG